MTYPNDTGPLLQTKATTYDTPVNTSQHFNAKDWNDMRTLVHALRNQLVGTYRGYVERRSAGTLTAVRVHTLMALVDGYRKSTAVSQLLIPGVTGSTWVYVQGNTGPTAMIVRTAAAEPSPYGTVSRFFPLARVDISGGQMTVTHTRPDWVLQHRL